MELIKSIATTIGTMGGVVYFIYFMRNTYLELKYAIQNKRKKHITIKPIIGFKTQKEIEEELAVAEKRK